MEKLMELLSRFAETGETKLEVSVRLMNADFVGKDPKKERPFDKEKRLSGYRGVAEFLGISINSAMKMAREGRIPIYTMGRKVFAYEDEVISSLAGMEMINKTVGGILERHGYEIRKVDKAVAV